jgi:ABC-type uncharacterized transport system ATPase subunit
MSSESKELIEALTAHTKAIQQLVKGNQQVIALLTEVVSSLTDDDDPMTCRGPEPATFMDGTSR